MFWNERTGIAGLFGSFLGSSERFGKFLWRTTITIVVVAILLLNRTFTWDTMTNTVATTATAILCFAIYFGAIGLLIWPFYMLQFHTRWKWPHHVTPVLWTQALGSIAWALIWHHTPTPEGAGDLATHSAQAFIVAALIGWTATALVLFSIGFFRVVGKAADRLTVDPATQPPAPTAWPAPTPHQQADNLPTLNWQPPDQEPPAGR